MAKTILKTTEEEILAAATPFTQEHQEIEAYFLDTLQAPPTFEIFSLQKGEKCKGRPFLLWQGGEAHPAVDKRRIHILYTTLAQGSTEHAKVDLAYLSQRYANTAIAELAWWLGKERAAGQTATPEDVAAALFVAREKVFIKFYTKNPIQYMLVFQHEDGSFTIDTKKTLPLATLHRVMDYWGASPNNFGNAKRQMTSIDEGLLAEMFPKKYKNWYLAGPTIAYCFLFVEGATTVHTFMEEQEDLAFRARARKLAHIVAGAVGAVALLWWLLF